MDPVQHTASFTLSQPVERVFPLFTPEGEKRWAPGWDYINVMETTELSEDYVFLTSAHDHSSTHAIWLMKRYLPVEGLVQYYRVEPEDKVGVVTVRCTATGTNATRVEVTYKYIPISDQGIAFIKDFTAEVYKGFIAGWQTHLENYFDTES